MRVLTAAALVFALGACGSQEIGPTGLKRDEVLAQISASARGEAVPDEARIGVGVTTVRATGSEASAEGNRVLTRITAALAELGVEPQDIQTQGLSLQRIDYGPERGRFRADNRVEVRLRDPARAGAAVAAATEAGGNVTYGPDLRVRDPERAYDKARAEALKAARARADAYAAAAGLKVKRLLAIQDGEIAGAPPIGVPPPVVAPTGVALEARVQAMDAANAPPVSAGTNVRTVWVRADFVLG